MSKNIVSNRTTPEDMAKCRFWAERLFKRHENLPVSFLYDAKKIRGIPDGWNPSVNMRRIDANIVEWDMEGRDPETGLVIRLECFEYKDYPVWEWTGWLTNHGSEPTPVISDLLAADSIFSGASPVLYHCNGDFGSDKGYEPERTPMGQCDTIEFSPVDGFSCDRAFAYYKLLFEDCGLAIAIGWPGQWSARFTGTDGGMHVAAGQQKTYFKLMPGEKVRTPRMTVMAWTGDETRGVNMWRRWYLAHVIPKPDGGIIKPMLTCSCKDSNIVWFETTDKNQMQYIKKFWDKGIDFDTWWMDLGWYESDFKPAPDRFPNGIKPISDLAAERGVKLINWFEAERVKKGFLSIEKEHPEWMLHATVNENEALRDFYRQEIPDSIVLNLGLPECRRWLTDHICGIIKENGIGIYRQDLNVAILKYWRENDTGERQGMTENLYVQGYLQYLDDLLARNPGLWMDNCNGGGRRNDMEHMRRAVPLHYTDFGYGNAPMKTAFHHTLFSWIPYFKEFTLTWDFIDPENSEYDTNWDKFADKFGFYCAMVPMLFETLDIRRDDYDYGIMKEMCDVWRKSADIMLNGDYYPLTGFSKSDEKWVVRQFDIPETGKGLIYGIRHAACPDETITVIPGAVRNDKNYIFENAETGRIMEICGHELECEGFTLELPKRSGAIWLYSTCNTCNTDS